MPASRNLVSSCGSARQWTRPPAGEAVTRQAPAKARTNGDCSHDVVAALMRRRSRPSLRRVAALLLVIPLLAGLIGAPSGTSIARGDELADAKAQQAKLKAEVQAQKARVASLNALQGALAAEIRATKNQLAEIGADLTAVRAKITTIRASIVVIRGPWPPRSAPISWPRSS
jgi:septal ring factor EnvC (AmiA/AmiB activator)